MNLARRRKARKLIMQALYQWQMSGGSSRQIEAQFREEAGTKVDWDYFCEVLPAIIADCDALDARITPLLDREFKSLDPVEKALLRMGAFELTQRVDIPYRVVINESVDLARSFGASESHKYINSILDRLAKSERRAEISTGVDTLSGSPRQ
ncbi:MAG: transcription antitermination factor NusB [Pseudohongiellaceae bacterium]